MCSIRGAESESPGVGSFEPESESGLGCGRSRQKFPDSGYDIHKMSAINCDSFTEITKLNVY